jgi:signal transduction histidine kinase
MSETELESARLAHPPAALPELGEVRSLHESYARLLVRVAAMERDLARANATLRAKVAELDEANGKLDSVLDAMPAGVIFADARGVVARANPAAAKILDITPAALPGMQLSNIKTKLGTALFEGAAREREIEGADGEARCLARTRTTVKDARGASIGTVDLLEDRTDRRRLERRLKHHETLAALGEMAATVAHEVRNPLHAIEGFANLLLRALPAGAESKGRTYANNIVRGVRELNATITNLLDFAKAERFQPFARDLAAVALRARESALAAGDGRHAIEYAGPASLIIAFDETHISQALRNLLANAMEAMPAGGNIKISISQESAGAAIRVADEGPGVRPEKGRKIFEPFFTTKPRGTGLGLAIVAKAAAIHGGRVSLEPSERGALFNLWIPNQLKQEQEL